MSLFVVRHRHEPDRCPAGDATLGAMLLHHLGRATSSAGGVKVRSEAVLQGEHSLLLILEADGEEAVRSYMAPFAEVGTVDIQRATTCAGVLAAGGCAAPPLDLGDEVAAVDPGEACQEAIEAGLIVHRAHPLNCETSIPALIGGVVMPNARFYVRNHFQIPLVDAEAWRLQVSGAVDRPLVLSLRELRQMPSATAVLTLECAGNGRSQLSPPVEGEPWQLGAASTAEWTGVQLVEVLDRAGVRPEAREVLFRGADRGVVDGRPAPINFERSLSVADARASGALLVYAMNGEPLPVLHGAPARVVVPGWYAVTSVKWLAAIELLTEPFDGYFQVDRYQYEWEREEAVEREPVGLQRVRSIITAPAAGGAVPAGELTVRGVAWSGASTISRVDVSVGGGPWQQSHLVGARDRHRWQWWELITRVERPGPTAIRARATDMAGRVQPAVPEWNRLGYGANGFHVVDIDVVETGP